MKLFELFSEKEDFFIDPELLKKSLTNESIEMPEGQLKILRIL